MLFSALILRWLELELTRQLLGFVLLPLPLFLACNSETVLLVSAPEALGVGVAVRVNRFGLVQKVGPSRLLLHFTNSAVKVCAALPHSRSSCANLSVKKDYLRSLVAGKQASRCVQCQASTHSSGLK